MLAKRYLDDPFEIALNDDLLGERTSASKVTCSDPINAPHVTSWEELSALRQGVLVLNGDSSHLPIPDTSVDAVVTGPPYFEFVHYSELSDFFFAWLSPALIDRYAWFDKHDSSDSGEVQHKDPRAFARQLSYVLKECCRVLKDDGVLAFSFHHSREEGWAAISEAVIGAGFEVVAAHPVHAEQRGSSPKNATSNPISLDAIIVCCKDTQAKATARNLDSIINAALTLAEQLSAAGMFISAADCFVIAASQTLISASAERLSFEQIKNRLEAVRQKLEEKRAQKIVSFTGDELRPLSGID